MEGFFLSLGQMMLISPTNVSPTVPLNVRRSKILKISRDISLVESAMERSLLFVDSMAASTSSIDTDKWLKEMWVSLIILYIIKPPSRFFLRSDWQSFIIDLDVIPRYSISDVLRIHNTKIRFR